MTTVWNDQLTGKASQDVCSFSSICPSCTTRSKLARCVPYYRFQEFLGQTMGTSRSDRRTAPAGKAVSRCNKRRFRTKIDALVFASAILKKPFCVRTQFQAYHCGHCKVGTLAIGSGKHHRCLQCAPNELIDQLAVAPLSPRRPAFARLS